MHWGKKNNIKTSCAYNMIIYLSCSCSKTHWLSCMLLTHWDQVTHLYVTNLAIIGSDNGLAPSHYLNQWWNTVIWTLGNKLQWNLNQNSSIFIEERAFEKVCKMTLIWLSLSVLTYSTTLQVQKLPGHSPAQGENFIIKLIFRNTHKALT